MKEFELALFRLKTEAHKYSFNEKAVIQIKVSDKFWFAFKDYLAEKRELYDVKCDKQNNQFSMNYCGTTIYCDCKIENGDKND